MIQPMYIFFFTPSNYDASISNPNGPNSEINMNKRHAVIRVIRLTNNVKMILKNSCRISFGTNKIVSILNKKSYILLIWVDLI